MDLPDLRPLSFGELLDRIFTYYRRHFRLFVLIMAVPEALIIALSILSQSFQGGFAMAATPGKIPAPSPGYVAGLFFGLMLVFGLYGVLYLIALGATTFAVSEIHLGNTTTARAAYQKVRGRFWRLLGLNAAILIRVVLMVGACFLGFGMLVLIPITGKATNGVVVPLLVGLVSVIALIAGVIWAFRRLLGYSCAVPALLLEDLKAGAAIRRSLDLTKQNLGRVSVLVLLMSVVGWAVALLLQGPFSLAVMVLFVKSHTQPPFWLGALSIFAGGVGRTVTGPLLMIGIVLLYYDIRVRKEAFDLQVMMSALDAQSPVPGVSEDYLLPVQPPIAEMSVLGTISLTVLTLGLYGPLWFLLRRAGINRLHSRKKLGVLLPIVVLLLAVIMAGVNFGVGHQVSFINEVETFWSVEASGLLLLAIWVLMTIQSLKARKILEEHVMAHPGGPLAGSIALLQRSSFSTVATFFFGIVYLQYKINEMVETWPQGRPANEAEVAPAA